MSSFFIKRPVFAWVIAILIMLAGLLAIRTLPVAQYPAIALPQISVTANYPGASAETLSDVVTQVIEQNMNGLGNLVYMSSTSEASGTARVVLTFAAGTDPDLAQVQVQNKLQKALPLLPDVVQRLGVSVDKTSSNYLMVVAFVSADRSMDSAAIADYAVSNLRDSLSRLPGVGDLSVFGSQHAMRIWVDPDQLDSYRLTLADVTRVLKNQNLQVSAGQFGSLPQTAGQQLNATITAQTLLQTPEQFRNIVVRVNRDGSSVTLGQVSEVEVGQESYSIQSFYNGQPAAGLGIYLASGANALDTAQAVRDYIAGAAAFFPPGLEAVYPYDTTPFVRISIHEVVKTLIEAILLVFVVMYIFLQNFRATLIPAIAVPVVLLGVFGILALFGYSINTLTLFGMVLAIGLLVDDAIVVVENVMRLMEEEGLGPREAAEKSMREITGALVGIALVLSAVFVPMAFSSGSTGAIMRQFSITIVSAMILSALVALILTPALCATILRPHHGGESGARGWSGWFNRNFAKTVDSYGTGVAKMLGRSGRFLVIYLALACAMAWLFMRLPTSFLPDEDQGVLLLEAQLPAGATLPRTLAAVQAMETHFLENETEAVASVFSVAGYGFSGSGQNSAIAFVSLKNWDERNRPELGVKAVAARAAAAFARFHDAQIYPIVPPAVPELGMASGFDLQLVDMSGLGHAALMRARDEFLTHAASDSYRSILAGVRPNGKSDTPRYSLEVDLDKASAFEVDVADIHDMLQNGWGGGYINDYMEGGRLKKVYIQARAEARMLPEDFDNWPIRNRSGGMTPFGSLIQRKWTMGSPRLERYNGLPSLEIIGNAAAGISTGRAMEAAEAIAGTLPAGIGLFWTGISLQEKESGAQSLGLYALSLIVVFLCLAALYESWGIPFSVLLAAPLGALGVAAAALVFKQANDVYFQVGFLTIIGLSAKNAILIVEFAKALHEEGMEPLKAAVTAATMRLRPIVMTSLAFILGVLPLAISRGAGSGGQNAIGIGVIGGMIVNTVLGVFYIPLFFTTVTALAAFLGSRGKGR